MQHFSRCLSVGMKTRLHVNLVSLFRLLLVTAAATVNYTRDDFPVGFVFGSGTSAYQYEGAASDYGRTPSIWDTFARRKGDSNGDVACDGYHKFKDDIMLMSQMGIEAFRFSISWSRLLPKGRGPVNPLGLRYYNDFIDQLVHHGIQPHVTLYHLDLPQVLQDEYGGWLDKRIVKDFVAYSEACFKEFGDRVKFWTTINEANGAASGGYSGQGLPPGRCSPSYEFGCIGNSSVEPYIVGHNFLLAHSAVWRLYKKKYEATQKGQVGFNILAFGIRPKSNAEDDIEASQRTMEFYNLWLLNPLVFGKYPESMSKRAKGRIPIISKYESEQMKGSFDFFGVNHYTTYLIKDAPRVYNSEKWSYDDDIAMIFQIPGYLPGQYSRHGYPILPSGFLSILEYLKEIYGNPNIYIQENGQSTPRSRNLIDIARVEYLDAYIGAMLSAIRNGSNIKGYMTWTFLDCFELFGGYTSTLGFYYVDLDDEHLTRYEKYSGRWFSDFLRSSAISKVGGKGKRADIDHLRLHSA